MGLVSLLCWLQRPTAPSLTSLASPRLTHPPPDHSLAAPPPSPARERVSFTLPTPVYAWLEAASVAHNYGSVRKSVRDILAWASVAHDDDLDWLFATDHPLPDPPAAPLEECGGDPRSIAGSQAQAARCGRFVKVDARVSEPLLRFMQMCVTKYRLAGYSVVLETLCRCVIVQRAACDVFASEESGQTLPTSSTDLYHDLGIKCHHWR